MYGTEREDAPLSEEENQYDPPFCHFGLVWFGLVPDKALPFHFFRLLLLLSASIYILIFEYVHIRSRKLSFSPYERLRLVKYEGELFSLHFSFMYFLAAIHIFYSS